MKSKKLGYFVITLATISTACGGDDAAAANTKAAAAACNPVGTYNLARNTFTGAGGDFCTNNANIQNGGAATRTFVSTKNADGTFSFLKQGEDDDGFKKMTLDAAKCTLTATENGTSTQLTDAKGGFGTTNETETATVTFTNNAANLTYQVVRSFSAAKNVSPEGDPNVAGVPCTLTSNTTGTKM